MARSADDLASDVLALPLPERARLIDALIASLDEAEGEDPVTVAAAWDAELERRDRELDAAPDLARPAGEAFASAERRLAEVRARRGAR